MIRTVLLLSLALSITLRTGASPEGPRPVPSAGDGVERIAGVCLTGPPRPVPAETLDALDDVGAGWVAVVPYAFSRTDDPGVWFDHERQWWGERSEGVSAQVRFARERGLRVMVKPHIWVLGQGWLGDYHPGSEAGWEAWEADYRRYILHFARMADSLDAELFCIGTEARVSVRERPAFWRGLIAEVRGVYGGRLTYAANWDNAHRVPFWDLLDLVGVDAYFPIHEGRQPGVAALLEGWAGPLRELESLHAETGKPILFTEFGYQSVDGAAGRHWELETEKSRLPVNLQAQADAFEALFRACWERPWFRGGFLWKWYLRPNAGGPMDRDYTPQGKPSSAVIRSWYAGQAP
jgi:hypothetical protein